MTTTLDTNLDSLMGPTPLLMQYAGQYQPQDAYIEVHASGKIYFEYNSEIGNAVPASVWHDTVRRISIPNDLTSNGYAELFESIANALQTIVNGMGERWDGNNWVGTLTDEAQEALNSLEQSAHFEDLERDEDAIAELNEQNN